MKSDFAYAALVLALALSACDGGKKQAAQGTAGGEVLEGSVSDAMLPVDRVRSQPPLAPKADGSDQPGKQHSGSDKGKAGATADKSPAAGAGPSAGAPVGGDEAGGEVGGGEAPAAATPAEE